MAWTGAASWRLAGPWRLCRRFRARRCEPDPFSMAGQWRLGHSFRGLAPLSHRPVDVSAWCDDEPRIPDRELGRPDRFDSSLCGVLQAVESHPAADGSVRRALATALPCAARRVWCLVDATCDAPRNAPDPRRRADGDEPAVDIPFRPPGALRALASAGGAVALP